MTTSSSSKTKAYIMLTTSMLIWGSLAFFVKQTSLTSNQLVLCRLLLGIVFLGTVFIPTKKRITKDALKKHGIRLLFSGVIMGFNWVCLFQSYKYTSVGIATLCYYMAPVIVLLGSAIFYRERLTLKKLLSAAAAVTGLVLVTGTSDTSLTAKGVIYGLSSAVLYAGVTLINKSVKGLTGLEITITQLTGATLVMLPFTLIKDGFPVITNGVTELVCVLILGIVHTGAALYMYFSSIQTLPVGAVAVMSYIDPASALFFAAILLNEKLGLNGVIGAVLIIGGAVFNEVSPKGLRKNRQ